MNEVHMLRVLSHALASTLKPGRDFLFEVPACARVHKCVCFCASAMTAGSRHVEAEPQKKQHYAIHPKTEIFYARTMEAQKGPEKTTVLSKQAPISFHFHLVEEDP